MQIPRILIYTLAAASLGLAAALRHALVKYHLVNGSVEIYLPASCLCIGVGLFAVKHRIALAALAIAAVLAIAFAAFLVFLAGAAPYAR